MKSIIVSLKKTVWSIFCFIEKGVHSSKVRWQQNNIFLIILLENDYSQPTTRNYELKRSQIVLSETIGVGQFGDVYMGCFHKTTVENKTNSSQAEGSNEQIINVAVKTCKADADLKTSEKFLEEACE